MSQLIKGHCVACEGGVPRLSGTEIDELMPQLHQDWCVQDNQRLQRMFKFANYYQTMAFVNAIAFMAHRENHHPDLSVHYDRCMVEYSTHAIDGLSTNDFICAAKVDQLLI